MTATKITLTDAVSAILAAGDSTPEKMAAAIEGAVYIATEDAVLLSPSLWFADDGNQEEEYDDCDSGREAAESYVEGGDWGKDEAGISVNVWQIALDSDGDECEVNQSSHTVTVNEGGTGLAAQKECTVIATDRGEFTTESLAVRPAKWGGNDEFVVWENNGGHRGAHDRMDGNGKWRETYDAPTEITAAGAVQWLVDHAGLDEDESVEKLASESSWSEDELAEDIA